MRNSVQNRADDSGRKLFEGSRRRYNVLHQVASLAHDQYRCRRQLNQHFSVARLHQGRSVEKDKVI